MLLQLLLSMLPNSMFVQTRRKLISQNSAKAVSVFTSIQAKLDTHNEDLLVVEKTLQEQREELLAKLDQLTNEESAAMRQRAQNTAFNRKINELLN